MDSKDFDVKRLSDCILEIFYKLSAIPHGSGDTAAMKEYLIEFAKSCGYHVRLDNANNILASLNDKKLGNIESKNVDSKIDSKDSNFNNEKVIESNMQDSNNTKSKSESSKKNSKNSNFSKTKNIDSITLQDCKNHNLDLSKKDSKVMESRNLEDSKNANNLVNLDSKVIESKSLDSKNSNIPKVCFQSHYDMVCVGEIAKGMSPKLIKFTEIIESNFKDSKLRESTTKNTEKLQNIESKNIKSSIQDSKNIESKSTHKTQKPTPLAPPNINIKQGGGNHTQDSKDSKLIESTTKNIENLRNIESKTQDSKLTDSITTDSKNLENIESITQKSSKDSNTIKQTWLKAQDSSLGADNGIGMAIMLYFMQQKIDAEFLFTNDEEIGMIGAKNLSLPIHSQLLINLDSERLGEITIGCAGGFDFTFSGRFHAQNLPHGCHYYTLKAKNFVGGHSGIDINNKSPNFQNAIIKSLTFLAKITESSNYEIKIIHIQGGEKRNSIPANCKIIFASENSLDTLINAVRSEFFEISKNESVSGRDIKPLNETFMHKKPCAVGFRTLFDFISSIKIGVLESVEGVVQSSLNLSQICFDDGVLNLAFMGRANTRTLLDSNLEALKHALCNCKLLLDVKTQVGEYYAPWEKDAAFSYEKFYSEVANLQEDSMESKSQDSKTDFIESKSQNAKDSANFNDKNSQNLALKLLYKNMQKYVRDVGLSPKIVELHAGLECGILLSQFAKMNCQNITALSIGPSIHSPHSTKERVWIESCGITTQILLDFLSEYK